MVMCVWPVSCDDSSTLQPVAAVSATFWLIYTVGYGDWTDYQELERQRLLGTVMVIMTVIRKSTP